MPVTVGLVASYLSGNPRAAVFPARSRQTPMTEAASASGPSYVTAGQASMPAIASVPVKENATGRLYQPFASALRPALAPVTVGSVASYLSANEREPTLPAKSRQVPSTDAPPLSGPE
jgi:hypothetical protein